jgi:hypothetical protein
MNQAAYDLVILCGTTFDASTMKFVYRVDDIPVDLTGLTARSKARTAKHVIFDASTENGKLVLGGEDGSIAFNFTADETAAMWVAGLPLHSVRKGVPLHDAGRWDIELVSADGRVIRPLGGQLFLSPEVTR